MMPFSFSLSTIAAGWCFKSSSCTLSWIERKVIFPQDVSCDGEDADCEPVQSIERQQMIGLCTMCFVESALCAVLPRVFMRDKGKSRKEEENEYDDCREGELLLLPFAFAIRITHTPYSALFSIQFDNIKQRRTYARFFLFCFYVYFESSSHAAFNNQPCLMSPLKRKQCLFRISMFISALLHSHWFDSLQILFPVEANYRKGSSCAGCCSCHRLMVEI